VPGLGTSFGRGGATNFQQDIANADCVIIQGSNMAEAHPVGFQWVVEAKARGAKVIHIDPRFTRTSALADTYVPLRAGSDIAFLGGIINYVLANELDFREYVVAYTNAANIVSEDYQDTEDLDGLFSGFDPETRTYDPTSWQYAGQEQDAADDDMHMQRETASALQHETHGGGTDADPQRDETLQHPRCVYQILKRHFARYTPEVVEALCGVPPEKFREVCEAWTANSGRERTTMLVYSVGWTQHSTGVQYIRTGAILQLLLGNVGRPGRRHHGDARAREHPGLDRHPDALQHPAGLPARCRTTSSTRRCSSGSTPCAIRARRGSGATPAPTASACSRPTGATRRPPRTTTATTTCPA
jgi:formate dehydrogenase major subunit